MPTTKIINVQKGDSFADVFNIFKHADAEEVIFIFPKGSKFAQSAEHFAQLKDEADSAGKTVNIMSADPAVAELAVEHGFTVLGGSRPKSRAEVAIKTRAEPDWEPINSENGDEEKPPEAEEEDETERSREDIGAEFSPHAGSSAADDSETEATLAAFRRSGAGRTVRVRVSREQEEKRDRDIVRVWKRWRNTDPDQPPSRRRLRPTKIIGIIFGAILLIGFFLLYSRLASATITLKPVQRPIDQAIKASASANTAAVNYDFRRVPGQLVGAEAEKSARFPVTGRQEVVQKAKGRIIIRNTGASDQRLVATTRFEAPNGFIFRIPATVMVPAGGSVESAVNADKAGPEYNLPATQFTVPGLKGTLKYNEISAVSTAVMAGGFIGPAKVVTEADWAKAVEAVSAAVKAEVLKKLRDQAGGLKILDAIAVTLAAPTANAKTGEAADELAISLHGSAQTVAFRENDINDLISRYLADNGGQTLVPNKTAVQLEDGTLDTSGKVLNFKIKLGGMTADQLDDQRISREVAGLGKAAVRDYFSRQTSISSAEVILSPFWVGSVPKDQSRIKLRIEHN